MHKQKYIRHKLRGTGLRIEDPQIREIEIPFIKLRAIRQKRIPLVHDIACVFCDQVEYVSADIPAAKVVQTPICFDGRELRVMVVEIGICSSD
jgi:hypothetical protein